MTGIKQGDTLFSPLVAPKSDARSIPRALQGAHVPGTAEGANPTLGKAGPLIPPSLGLGTHLRGAPPAGVPRDPAFPRSPLSLGRSAPAERCKGAADAPGRRRQRAGRGRFPGRRGRASGPRTVTGGRPRRQVRAPAGRHGVPGERYPALPAAEGPAGLSWCCWGWGAARRRGWGWGWAQGPEPSVRVLPGSPCVRERLAVRLPGRARLGNRRGHLGGESGAGSPRCPDPRRSGLAVQVPPERRRRASAGCSRPRRLWRGWRWGWLPLTPVLSSRDWYLSCLRAAGVY